jgi:hypothetical protein
MNSIPNNKRKKWRYPTAEAALQEIKRRHERGLPLNSTAINHGEFSDWCLYNQSKYFFGNWQTAIEAAGLNYQTISTRHRSPYRTKECIIKEVNKRYIQKQLLNTSSLISGTKEDKSFYYRAIYLFGTWQNVIEASGLDPQEVYACNPIGYDDPESILREIKRRKKEELPLNAKALQTGEYRDISLLKKGRDYFESWPKALEAAGLDCRTFEKRRQNPYPTAQSVTEEIIRRSQNGIPLNARALQIGQHKDITLYNRGITYFGNWKHCINTAGLDYEKISHRPPERFPTPETIILEIARRQKNDQSLFMNGLQTEGGSSVSLLNSSTKFFGSWKAAIEAAGLDYAQINRNPRSQYHTKDAVIKAILERHDQGLPINARALQKGEHPNHGLYKKGAEQFKSWQTAVEEAGLEYPARKKRTTDRFPTRDAIIETILARVSDGLPVTSQGLSSGQFNDSTLYIQGRKQFTRWVYALLIAWKQGTNIDRIALRTAIEGQLLRELRRRCKEGLSLVDDELRQGTEEEVALIECTQHIFGSWPAALSAANVVWDWDGIATINRSTKNIWR